MLDIHVIPKAGFEDNMFKMVQALVHPLINVYHSSYIFGNILEARIAGFSKGTSKYVTWIDSDDTIVNVEWVEKAIQVLEMDNTISAIYPRWNVIEHGKIIRTTPEHEWSASLHATWSYMPYAHHLTIMRREQVLESLMLAKENVKHLIQSTERYLVSSLVKNGRLISEPTIAYNWHLHPNTARTKNDSVEAQEWLRKEFYIHSQLAKLC
jgi:glycosyltransferase involved in cell wall biosynthesis